jgi:hypothetical protein
VGLFVSRDRVREKALHADGIGLTIYATYLPAFRHPGPRTSLARSPIPTISRSWSLLPHN